MHESIQVQYIDVIGGHVIMFRPPLITHTEFHYVIVYNIMHVQ